MRTIAVHRLPCLLPSMEKNGMPHPPTRYELRVHELLRNARKLNNLSDIYLPNASQHLTYARLPSCG